MNICHKGRELLLDLQRSEWLPQYDDDGIRIIIAETESIHHKINEIFPDAEQQQLDDEDKVTLLYYQQAFMRNIRYLYSYMYHRLNKIRNLRWETGVVVPENIRQTILSSHELDYFSEYNEILNEYNSGLDLDLTADLIPPKDLFIEVLVLEDCGEILTENGVVNLNKGARPYLRRSDIEHLIRQGKCSHILE